MGEEPEQNPNSREISQHSPLLTLQTHGYQSTQTSCHPSKSHKTYFYQKNSILITARIYISPMPVLFPIDPLPHILSPVGPGETAIAMFFIVHIFAFITAVIFPGHFSLAVHFIHAPIPTVVPPVRPIVIPESFYIIIFELALYCSFFAAKKNTV
jgi:hypothetical protein